jgi:CRP/FNR family cyclic AMP-dependent transcriptional regulator
MVPHAAPLLRSIPMFEGLSDDDLMILSEGMTERRFLAGEKIFDQGDRGTEMFIVIEGLVNIHLPGEAARRVSLKDVGRGEHFGELALFDDKPRSATAQATRDTVLLELTRQTLSAYVERRPRAALPILATMAARLRDTYTMISDRAAKNAVEEIEKNLTWGDQLADKVAELNGSWSFLLAIVGLIVIWGLVNGPFIQRGVFDPYPYIFFNLVLQIVVALQGPLIVMSQNRQTLKDRATAETDFKVNLKNEVNVETIVRELGEFRSETSHRLETLERAARR